jgi:UDP-N-acetylglucosamine 2-epimerase
MKIILVVDARPNPVKIAPIIDAIKDQNRSSDLPFIHTGRYYDEKMSKLFNGSTGSAELLLYPFAAGSLWYPDYL